MLIIAPGQEAKQGYLSIFLSMKVCCVISLESPHRGDSNEYTQYTIFIINTKITINYPKSAGIRFLRGTQERVRNSREKRVISGRAIEVLLYLVGMASVKGPVMLSLVACSGASWGRCLLVQLRTFFIRVIAADDI